MFSEPKNGVFGNRELNFAFPRAFFCPYLFLFRDFLKLVFFMNKIYYPAKEKALKGKRETATSQADELSAYHKREGIPLTKHQKRSWKMGGKCRRFTNCVLSVFSSRRIRQGLTIRLSTFIFCPCQHSFGLNRVAVVDEMLIEIFFYRLHESCEVTLLPLISIIQLHR